MHRLYAVAHVAPGSTIVERTAISLPPEIHHGVAPPCVSRPDYPARFGLDRLRTRCSQDEKYPALVNSDTGAQHVEIYCAGELEGTPGMYTYAFTEFDKVTEFVTKGTRIGIALPLKGDEFRVIRFDLTGAPAAIANMQAAYAQKTRPTRQGTRDQKL